jgi:hypothetical protein
MVCELVDNALDAGAEHVWIELGRRSVVVADDGSAMEDINDAVRFGKGTRAGRRGDVSFELARARHPGGSAGAAPGGGTGASSPRTRAGVRW